MFKLTAILACLLVLQGVMSDRQFCLQKNREMVDLARQAMNNGSGITAQDLCNAMQATINACRDVLPEETTESIIRTARGACGNSIRSAGEGHKHAEVPIKDFAEGLVRAGGNVE